MKSNYILLKCDSSYCKNCDAKVQLLTSRDGRPGSSFYICFNCHYVCEVGIGPVNKSIKCGCKEPKKHDDCAYCGMGSIGKICGVCKEQGIDGPVIRGTSRVICKVHKMKKV
jgi:hypothetical protein